MPEYVSYFFEETYENALELPENIVPADAAAILRSYITVYDAVQDKQEWFDTIKSICADLAFSPDVKAYKSDPTAFKGHVGDVSTVIRIAITGRRNTPDLCSIMQLLGTSTVKARLQAAINTFENRI